MNDIKMSAKNEAELKTDINYKNRCSQHIGMEFSLEKWAKLIMKSAKRQIMEGIELPNQERIWTLWK